MSANDPPSRRLSGAFGRGTAPGLCLAYFAVTPSWSWRAPRATLGPSGSWRSGSLSTAASRCRASLARLFGGWLSGCRLLRRPLSQRGSLPLADVSRSAVGSFSWLLPRRLFSRPAFFAAAAFGAASCPWGRLALRAPFRPQRSSDSPRTDMSAIGPRRARTRRACARPSTRSRTPARACDRRAPRSCDRPSPGRSSRPETTSCSIFLLFSAFSASIRAIKRSSTDGPFLLDRLICCCPFHVYGRARCTGRKSCSSARAIPERGHAPRRHRMTAGRGRALPPPCGWSTGFMAVPRVCGRTPMWRLCPALPTFTFWRSASPIVPTVARHSARTSRISPEGGRSVPSSPSLPPAVPRPRPTRQRAAAAGLQLDVVDHRADRHPRQLHATADGDVGALAGGHGHTDREALRARGCNASPRRRSAAARCRRSGSGRTRSRRPAPAPRPCDA